MAGFGKQTFLQEVNFYNKSSLKTKPYTELQQTNPEQTAAQAIR